MALVLIEELEFFEEHRAAWNEHYRGKFVLVKGRELFGVFDTCEAAFEAGAASWGNVPFLIKEVLPQDRIEQIPALVYGLLNAHLSSAV
jgi:hypothetical protein